MTLEILNQMNLMSFLYINFYEDNMQIKMEYNLFPFNIAFHASIPHPLK